MKKLSVKKGFTLVELLVVMAMLMLLIGSISSSVMSAQKRARLAVATTAVLEISNAILAYENYGKLDKMDEQPSTEDNLAFILGKATEDGRDVPVLYNASIKGGKILDPKKGKVYSCEMWRKGENLIVRGKIAFIGRNQTWLPCKDDEVTKESKPLVPAIPRLK